MLDWLLLLLYNNVTRKELGLLRHTKALAGFVNLPAPCESDGIIIIGESYWFGSRFE